MMANFFGRGLVAGHLAAMLILGAGLSACSDSEDTEKPGEVDPGDDKEPGTDTPDPTPAADLFDEEPVLFEAAFGAGNGQICYHLAQASIVDCAQAWDLMFEVDGRAWSIWTNSSYRGGGDGAAFGPILEEDVDAFQKVSDIPGWFADSVGGVFLSSPWQSYNVMGSHDITANQRVYVVREGTEHYKVQMLSYYGGNGASGMIHVRWSGLDDSAADARELVIDARAGGFGAAATDPKNRYAYLNLETGDLLEITDAEARDSSDWHLGFKRFSVLTNSGVSGPADIRGALAVGNAHLYNSDGAPNREAFEGINETSADASFNSVTSADGLTFTADTAKPYILSDGGAYSWMVVTPPPVGPDFNANPDIWWAVRGANRDSFAKLRVVDIDYSADAKIFTVELYRSIPDQE